MPAERRILVLGCGSIGRRHIGNLLQLAVGEIRAFDPVEAVRAAAGVAVFDQLERAWDWAPDIVIVASVTQQHVPLAQTALERNAHLFVEKPLSHSLSGLSELASAAAERRRVTMVGCNMRFHPGPAAVKALIEEKAVGPVIAARVQSGSYLPRWRPAQDYRQSYSASRESGGAILDCIHEIDLALWYLGPARLAAAASLPAASLGLETDGLAELLLRHESGALSSVHLNFVQRDYRRGCQIIGTEGTIYWDFGSKRVDVFGPDGSRSRSIPEPEGWLVNQMYVDEMKHFLAAVERGTETMNPIAVAQKTLSVALEARAEGKGRGAAS
jgi:predicted dehydrogenase